MTGPGLEIRARAETGKHLPIALLDEFERAVRLTARGRQPADAVAMVRRYLWAERVGDLSGMTTATVERYLADLAARRSPKTVMNHRSALSSFCAFLQRRGLLASNPCAGISLARPDKKLPRYLEQDEIMTVLEIAEEREIWPEVLLALSTGMRLGELIRLRWADVDIERKCLSVHVAKSGRGRVIPLNESAIVAIEAQRKRSGHLSYVFPARRTWRGGWRYVDKWRASNWWRRAMRPIQAAVPKFRATTGTGRGWHLFRHTFASQLAQEGVSLYKIAQWLGHSDVRTTQVYAHLRTGFDAEIEKASPLPTGRRRRDERRIE